MYSTTDTKHNVKMVKMFSRWRPSLLDNFDNSIYRQRSLVRHVISFDKYGIFGFSKLAIDRYCKKYLAVMSGTKCNGRAPNPSMNCAVLIEPTPS